MAKCEQCVKTITKYLFSEMFLFTVFHVHFLRHVAIVEPRTKPITGSASLLNNVLLHVKETIMQKNDILPFSFYVAHLYNCF
jgi:hypothetical protein